MPETADPTSATRTPIAVHATDGEARRGTVSTPRSSFETPCFMPVGTRAAVGHLAADDLEAMGVEVMLANTYHLMLRPGAEVVEAMGGLHGFMDWGGHVLTDSGGYQVFSLQPKVDADGVTFRSTYDGDRIRFTPEDAVRVQQQLGADIQMVLDVCPPLPSPRKRLAEAVDLTAAWAARAKAAHTRPDQALFGIVQGGTEPDLRSESARRTVEVGFDGYAVGGLSVGEDRSAMLDALAVAIGHLPADRPRYLMGVGDPVGIVESVALGIDMFDCVLPTRLARHGTVLTTAGRLNLRNRAMGTDDRPLDPDCGCRVCARWSRAYLAHLLRTKEHTGGRLVTLHNLHWLLALVDRVRDAVAGGTLAALRSEVMEVWGADGTRGNSVPGGSGD